MRTDGLIRAIAADNATRVASVERWLLSAIVIACAVSATLFALMLGPRADIAQVAGEFGFLFKFAFTLALAVTATILVLRLARPAADTMAAATALLIAPAMLGLAVVSEFASVEPAARTMKLVGTTWLTCLTFVPLLSAPILAAALIALRHGAPTRPALTGAIGGLLAGGFGATIYAAYCVEDSAFFLATWYSLAIAIVTALGALVGARVLRW